MYMKLNSIIVYTIHFSVMFEHLNKLIPHLEG